MRVGDNIKRDLLGEFDLSGCPQMFAQQARNLLELASRSLFDNYDTVTELTKCVTARYWVEHDGYEYHVATGKMTFAKWYVHKATNPEIIARALRWLRENGYIIIKPEVQEQAERKASMVRGQIG